jgi:hypothetical protein
MRGRIATCSAIAIALLAAFPAHAVGNPIAVPDGVDLLASHISLSFYQLEGMSLVAGLIVAGLAAAAAVFAIDRLVRRPLRLQVSEGSPVHEADR